MDKISALCRMVYNKETKSIDMGNLRASDYKFNKTIHLPRGDDAEKETKHNLRREEMLRIFDIIEKEELEKQKKGRRLAPLRASQISIPLPG